MGTDTKMDGVEKKPDDDAIVAATCRWNGRAMTYVTANILRSDGFNVRTDWVLRQLKRLEREGRVERVPSPYVVQICWRPTPTKDTSHGY